MRALHVKLLAGVGVLGVIGMLGAAPAVAGPYFWTNPSGGTWNDPANWNTSGYPAFFFDFAIFNLDAGYPVSAVGVTQIAGLDVASGAVRLSVPGNLQAVLAVGTSGMPASLDLVSGGIEASAPHTVGPRGEVTLEAGSRLVSHAGGTYGVDLEAGGVLRGNGGSVEGQVLRNLGTVSPGGAGGGTGVLLVGASSAAGYEQRGTGALAVDLAGYDPGTGYDRLQVVNGNLGVALGGSLVVTLADGFIPDPGSRFEVLTAPAYTGTFDTVTLPQLPVRTFGLEYGANAVTVTVSGPLTVEAALDIQPGACPNPLSVGKRGVIPVILLGSGALDVREVDLATVTLAGAAPARADFRDDAIGLGGEGCGSTAPGEDGFEDLVLQFPAEEVLAGLGPAAKDEVIPVDLTANLNDGTPVHARDSVWIRGGGNGRKDASSSEAAVAGLTPQSGPGEALQSVRFAVPAPGAVRLDVFSVTGARMAELVRAEMAPGTFTAAWDASGAPSGVYFYRLETPAGSFRAKLLVLR